MLDKQTFAESRLGRFTASEIHRLLVSGKKGNMFGDGAMTYINEKLAEIVTGEGAANASSMATDWGINMERDAAKWFTAWTGRRIEHYGVNNYAFFEYGNVGGCSPDAICLDESANVQFKCPFNSSNHIAFLLASCRHGASDLLRAKKPEYYAQCQLEMMSCKTEKCYFVSYDPRALNPEYRMAIIELLPDLEMQDEIKTRMEAAFDIIRESLKELKTLTIPDNVKFNP